jgi:hypothetical protein
MSLRYVSKRRRVRIAQMHCDGPRHQSDTLMDFDSITVEHGYGSAMDGDTHHFCSITCLRDWALALKSPAETSQAA